MSEMDFESCYSVCFEKFFFFKVQEYCAISGS